MTLAGLGHFHDDKGRFPSHWSRWSFHPMLVSGSRQILTNLGHESLTFNGGYWLHIRNSMSIAKTLPTDCEKAVSGNFRQNIDGMFSP